MFTRQTRSTYILYHIMILRQMSYLYFNMLMRKYNNTRNCAFPRLDNCLFRYYFIVYVVPVFGYYRRLFVFCRFRIARCFEELFLFLILLYYNNRDWNECMVKRWRWPSAMFCRSVGSCVNVLLVFRVVVRILQRVPLRDRTSRGR